MAAEIANEKVGFLAFGSLWMKGFTEETMKKVKKTMVNIEEMAKDDPRRVIHSMKAGFAISLVSLFYYFQPLCMNFGVSAMWAVMTVVALFEFSVGATVGKVVNRTMGTLIGCGLGFAVHHLANLTGGIWEPILLGLIIFLQAVATTFIRFCPKVAARFDYGATIFMDTFCMVSISGYQSDDEIVEVVQTRIVAVLVGAAICMVVSMLVFPVWAGQDLHNLVANNIEDLGNFMEGFAGKSLEEDNVGSSNDQKVHIVGLKIILGSKMSKFETLANFARWEAGHGGFRYMHPWGHYLKLENLTMQCACRIEILHTAYLNLKTQLPQETQDLYKEAFLSIAKNLKEVALSVKTMIKLPPSSNLTQITIANSNKFPEPSTSKFESSACKLDSREESVRLLSIITSTHDDSVVWLLLDMITSVEAIYEAVNELATLAKFKMSDESLNSNNQSPEKDQKSDTLLSKDQNSETLSSNEEHVISIIGEAPIYLKNEF